MSEMIHHFLDLHDIKPTTLRAILAKAVELKRKGNTAGSQMLLEGKKLAMIFEKPSTRTRVSFEVAITELGGHALILESDNMQLGRGEDVADTARVLSRYVDAMMVRTGSHHQLNELAENATIPVINGLSNRSHPCQVMADIMTFEEHRGTIKGKTVAWVGDGNNMANTYIQAAAAFDFTLKLACPKDLPPSADTIDESRARGGRVTLGTDPKEAVRGADAVIADTWVSMGDSDKDQRLEMLKSYQVNEELMSKAAPKALFMHCLPAHRGQEVTAEVIDGKQSVVWDEAENRLHVQKAILLWALGKIGA